MNCSICKRDGDEQHFEEHHLTPKARKGRETIQICNLCHDMVHKSMTTKELAKKYNTLEKIAAHPKMISWIQWISTKPNKMSVCFKEKK
jgi:hypothetical protein